MNKETPPLQGDIVSAMMDYEDGQLDQEQTVELFQRLVDSGLAWQLQGSYGRMAKSLIDQGLVTRPERK